MNQTGQPPLGIQVYLNSAQLSYFRQRLSAWRDELTRSIARRDAQPVDTRVPDWLDSAALRTEQELGSLKRQRARQILREIDAALGRIDSGDYGYCSHSGEEIGLERLEALPIARFSVAAQEELEQRRRGYR